MEFRNMNIVIPHLKDTERSAVHSTPFERSLSVIISSISFLVLADHNVSYLENIFSES